MTAKPFYHLCKLLSGEVAKPIWGQAVALVPFRPDEPEMIAALHALLSEAYEAVGDHVPPLIAWWQALSTDEEYEAALIFPVISGQGELIAFAHCWNSGFIKDVVVQSSWRRQGIGEALLLHCFQVFKARGADKICLKVEQSNPFGAERLYRRLGMVDA